MTVHETPAPVYSDSPQSSGMSLADLKPYPAMKDSSVRWLGEVPAHWEVQTVGRLGQLFKGNGASKADEVAVGVPCVRYGDLYTQHEFFITETKACVAPDRASAYTSIRFGDLLFAASGETDEDIGRSAVNLLQGDARCGGDVIVLRPSREFVPRFLGYAADSPASRVQKTTMGRGFTVVHIYGAQLKHLTLAVPPLIEQTAIVRFLDHADRRIRRYIRAKQKLIKLLEEQKQAVTHRAITRGLDPNVRLKPSGVESLGDVPEHWEVKPAKWFFREVDERSASGDEELLSVSHLTGVTPRSQKSVTMFMAESYVGHKMCRPGDVVINTMWAWMAALGVARQVGLVSPAYGVYRPRRGSPLIGDYADLLLRTRPYVSEYICRSTGIQSSRLRLYPDRFLRIPVVCPPEAEQRAILANVQSGTAEMVTAIAAARKEIRLLHEYRTRLISDVVTGKLDVREAAARLSDEAEEPELLDESGADGEADQAAADDTDEVAEEAEA
jgi:type I restriction enzyme S subunit